MANKLICCLGLPGSGKSTAAQKMVEDNSNLVIVNKDTIRRKLETQGWVWTREAEGDVLKERNRLISIALEDGKDVISDDTNLAPKHQNSLKQLAIKFRAQFEIKDFRAVPVETCVERDNLRSGKARVGRDVIVGMAKTYLNYVEPAKKVIPYEAIEGTPKAILVDLDGTLALHTGRSPYDTARCLEDKLNQPVYDIVKLLAATHKIVYCSGREDTFRPQSLAWLEAHAAPAGPLLMRAGGDTRNDAIVKAEIFDREIRNNYNVALVLDDRDRVVKMWRELGLTCLQVAPGDF